MISVFYYIDVLSSWCLYFEPMWADLKRRYADEPVTFDWRLAVIPPKAMAASREEVDGYYRRSAWVVKRESVLNSGWFESPHPDLMPVNAVAEAARMLGVVDDTARLALSEAGMVRGEKVTRYEVAAQVVAAACGLDAGELEKAARSDAVHARLREMAAAFDDLKVTQHPTVQIVSEIDDRAVFSGLVKVEPIVATIDAMLADARAYREYAKKGGQP